MTSTWGGSDGFSNGWINRELIASGKPQPHINVYGGEDRFWLGPEGGQFAIFFKPGAPYTVDEWQTPAPIDTEAYEVVSKGEASAEFQKDFELTNRAGTKFRVHVRRWVELLERGDAEKYLGAGIPESVEAVAYQTRNGVAGHLDSGDV
jgi:hypothetical protein